MNQCIYLSIYIRIKLMLAQRFDEVKCKAESEQQNNFLASVSFTSTVSPLHTNEFSSESMFKSSLSVSLTKLTYSTNTVGYLVLYSTRLIILFT